MGWNDEETRNVKRGMSASSKVLLGIIMCCLLIIVMLIILLINVQESNFKIFIDGAEKKSVDKDRFITTLNGMSYINIEEFSKLVGYEYHRGEYKSSIIDEDKCYVESENETATFYADDNTIYKLQPNKREEQYKEFKVDNTIKKIRGEMYASLDAIAKAFNVLVEEKENNLEVYNLDYLINIYNKKVEEWGYVSILEESFENKKALLYGCLVVRKEGGLYKIIDLNNEKEIALDRYKTIEFSENTKEFFVKDTLENVGILNLDGTTKLEPAFEFISVLDKKSDLYMIMKNKKYGVVSGNGKFIIYPEYDNIGLNSNTFLMLNELIPVCKDKKWGAFNKNGKLIIGVEYDEFGCSLTNIEINGIKEAIEPISTIEMAKGVIVRKENKYGLLDINGRELVLIVVDAIYVKKGIKSENDKYFMLYNGEELNVIEKLIAAGLIEDEIQNEDLENSIENTINSNTITNEVNGTVENVNTVNN